MKKEVWRNKKISTTNQVVLDAYPDLICIFNLRHRFPLSCDHVLLREIPCGFIIQVKFLFRCLSLTLYMYVNYYSLKKTLVT